MARHGGKTVFIGRFVSVLRWARWRASVAHGRPEVPMRGVLRTGGPGRGYPAVMSPSEGRSESPEERRRPSGARAASPAPRPPLPRFRAGELVRVVVAQRPEDPEDPEIRVGMTGRVTQSEPNEAGDGWVPRIDFDELADHPEAQAGWPVPEDALESRSLVAQWP